MREWNGKEVGWYSGIFLEAQTRNEKFQLVQSVCKPRLDLLLLQGLRDPGTAEGAEKFLSTLNIWIHVHRKV
jgi:hypothetical protein